MNEVNNGTYRVPAQCAKSRAEFLDLVARLLARKWTGIHDEKGAPDETGRNRSEKLSIAELTKDTPGVSVEIG